MVAEILVNRARLHGNGEGGAVLRGGDVRCVLDLHFRLGV